MKGGFAAGRCVPITGLAGVVQDALPHSQQQGALIATVWPACCWAVGRGSLRRRCVGRQHCIGLYLGRRAQPKAAWPQKQQQPRELMSGGRALPRFKGSTLPQPRALAAPAKLYFLLAVTCTCCA
jgi:hypothetical protein